MTLLNFFKFLYSGIELFKHIRCATIQSNLNEYQKWCIQIMGVKQRRIALNKPLSFQPTHTLKARRWGKSHTFRKLDVRNTPILLQLIKNVTIDTVGSLRGASCYLPLLLSLCIPSLLLSDPETSLFRVATRHDRPKSWRFTARNARVYGEKTVALWQLSTSRMASVHAIRRFH